MISSSTTDCLGPLMFHSQLTFFSYEDAMHRKQLHELVQQDKHKWRRIQVKKQMVNSLLRLCW